MFVQRHSTHRTSTSARRTPTCHRSTKNCENEMTHTHIHKASLEWQRKSWKTYYSHNERTMNIEMNAEKENENLMVCVAVERAGKTDGDGKQFGIYFYSPHFRIGTIVDETPGIRRKWLKFTHFTHKYHQRQTDRHVAHTKRKLNES